MDKLAEILSSAGIPQWGICRFSHLPPLLSCRAASRLPQHPHSVIACAFPYYIGEFSPRNVSRYAIVDDYHHIAGTMLETACREMLAHYPGEQFAFFVDNSPIPEVAAGQLAGLGVLGRHGMLIHPRWGSLFFVGTVVTSLSLSPTPPQTGGCLDCGRCIAACPGGALSGDRPFDPTRCRSAITQKKGLLTPWEEEQVRLGKLVWGCDICLDVCPMNRNVAQSPIRAFHHNPAPWLEPSNLDGLHRTKPYNWRTKSVLLRNYKLIYGPEPT